MSNNEIHAGTGRIKYCPECKQVWRCPTTGPCLDAVTADDEAQELAQNVHLEWCGHCAEQRLKPLQCDMYDAVLKAIQQGAAEARKNTAK